MTLSPHEIIKMFRSRLRSELVNDNNEFESEILSYYNKILELLSHNYEQYKELIPSVLNSLEENETKSLSYSLAIFQELFKKVLSINHVTKLNTSIFENAISETTNKKYLALLKQSFILNKEIRISDFSFKSQDLSENERKEIVSLLAHSLQDVAVSIHLASEQAEASFLNLPVLRSLLNSLNSPKLFYFVVGVYIDRLTVSEYFQQNRNVSEELLLSSFIDNSPEWGFFDVFRCYSNQSSTHASLLYANISMLITITSGTTSDKYLKELIWQSIKFFRNIGFYPMATDIYKSIPNTFSVSDFEKRSIDHSYFTCLLAMGSKDLPYEILDYLNIVREDILQSGEKDALPWLNTLYNLKRLYINADFSITGLGFYLQIFESIVPKEKIERFKNISEGNPNELKQFLKESLFKLNDTKFKSDIAYDNSLAITIASRLIEKSFEIKDAEAILLASTVKSDFTLTFNSKEVGELTHFKLQDFDKDNDTNTYSNFNELINKTDQDYFFIWLLVTEGKVFELSFHNYEFDFFNLKDWNWGEFKKLTHSKYFSSLAFDDTIKDNNNVRTVSSEEFQNQADEVVKRINFSKLKVLGTNSNPLLIIKDMELAKFPHNLFINDNDGFIHLEKPITNVISTDWYLANRDNRSLPSQYTKSVWIPTEGKDLTINQLYNSIEGILKEKKFVINENEVLERPLSSDLNIICSHGGESITNLQIVYPNNDIGLFAESIIGSGKILIFFVCFSGSYKNEYFKNDISSLVKTCLIKGYSSVIAPFWGLHVNIPKIWLQAFLDSMHKGQTIDFSVYRANIAVFKKYPTPAAWACMHLYGNPHLSLS
jgi:hypothetical protein